MSMLKSFFEIGADSQLFKELHIAQNTELCDQYMGKYPVVSISLKSVDAVSYAAAFDQVIDMINQSAADFLLLQESQMLSDYEKKTFPKIA